MYIPHSVGLIVSVSQKCASTSIRNEFHREGTRPLTDLAVAELRKSFWKVVGVVRDPIDRFESAYNFFQYGQCGHFPEGKKFGSFESFTDAVLGGLLDDHWAPQSSVLGVCDSYVDLESFPLDLHHNPNKHKERVAYRLDDLKRYYTGDEAIRGNAWQL